MSKKRNEKRRRVGIDTCILIHADREWNNPNHDDREFAKAAARFLSRLMREQCQLYISAISIAEFLVPLDSRYHANAIAFLRTQFVIVPFNLKASSIAAEIRSTQKPSGKVERELISADSKIIASMAAEEVDEFYSLDRKLVPLAKRFIHGAKLMPMHPETLLEIMDEGEELSPEQDAMQ